MALVEIEIEIEIEKIIPRIQQFDVKTLLREELGEEFNFQSAVEPAKRLIDLYQRLPPIESLDDFSARALQKLKNQANRDYSVLKKVLDFKLGSTSNPHFARDMISARDGIVSTINRACDSSLYVLLPHIKESLSRSVDFQRLDRETQETMKSISNKTDKLVEDMESKLGLAKCALDQVQLIAKEAGITLSATYFSTEAENHEKSAKYSRNWTILIAIVLVLFACLMMFSPIFIVPLTTYEMVQFSTSKFLLVSVIAYMLFFSARNFLNHKHNAIVNRHRQNALLTHKTLIEGTSDPQVREVVMVQAALCIFSSQTTGYERVAGNEGVSSKSAIDLISKLSSKSGNG